MGTLLLCDDHRLVRRALAELLEGLPVVSAVHQAASAEEALTLYPTLRPDAVLMDVRLPKMDGVTAAGHLIASYPDARVLLLSGELREEDRRRGLQLGALGYLHKDIDVTELAEALTVVLSGGDLLTPRQRRAATLDRGGTGLSEREVQVISGMASGLSNQAIAESLFLSEDTVKSHAKKLFAKIGVRDRAEAVAWGFRSGLLS